MLIPLGAPAFIIASRVTPLTAHTRSHALRINQQQWRKEGREEGKRERKRREKILTFCFLYFTLTTHQTGGLLLIEPVI